MGMFDSVGVTCPKCNQVIELQSKAGECLCSYFTLENAPADILRDLEHETHRCYTEGCNFTFRIRFNEKNNKVSVFEGKQEIKRDVEFVLQKE